MKRMTAYQITTTRGDKYDVLVSFLKKMRPTWHADLISCVNRKHTFVVYGPKEDEELMECFLKAVEEMVRC